MLQARIGRLPIEARRTLRAASVFGQTFWSGGLGVVLDTTAEDGLLWDALQILLGSELIERQADSVFPGQVQYGFRHILMRDAAYALLAESDRVALHRQAGLFLAEQAGVEPKMVAEHLVKGQEPQSAVRWFTRAARHAFDSNDLVAAMSCAEQALSCGAQGEELGALRALRTETAYWSGDYSRCRALAEEELPLLRPGTGRWYQAMTHALISRSRTGDLGALPALLEEMVLAAPATEAVAEKVIAMCRVGHARCIAGSMEQLEPLLQAAADLIAQHRVTAPRVLAQYHEAAAHLLSPSPLAYLQHAEQALANYEQAGNVRNVLFLRTLVAAARGWLGGSQDAERLLRANIAVCQKMKFRPALEIARVALGALLVRERRNLSEARQLVQEAVSWYRQISYLYLLKMLYLGLAEVEYADGNYDQALEWVAQTRAVSDKLGAEDYFVGVALAVAARALLRLGRATEALAAARRGYSLRQCTRPQTVANWEHWPGLALAEALLTVGENDEARQVLGDLSQWVGRLIEASPHPEWRDACRRVPDFARILELAAALAASQ